MRIRHAARNSISAEGKKEKNKNKAGHSCLKKTETTQEEKKYLSILMSTFNELWIFSYLYKHIVGYNEKDSQTRKILLGTKMIVKLTKK